MSRKIIKTQTVSDKKERDEIAQMSARAKKEVVEAQTKVEEAQAQFKELMRKIDNNVSIHKKLKGRIEKAEERVHKAILVNAGIEQNHDILKEENAELVALHSAKETEIKRINAEVQSNKVKLSAVQSDLSVLKDQKVRISAEIEKTKKDIQTVKDASGQIHTQTVALIEQSKLLKANIVELKDEFSTQKNEFEEHKSAFDIQITTAQEQLSRIKGEISSQSEILKQIKTDTAKELEAVKAERSELEIYRNHNMRLSNELNIKIKEVKAYRDKQIIGEFLTQNGL